MPDDTKAAPAAKPDTKAKPSKPPADPIEAARQRAARIQAENLNLFFDVRDAGYWFKLGPRFVKLGARDIKLHLFQRGYRDDSYVQGLREIDWPLWNAQMRSQIEYAGPLAGHPAGIVENGHRRLLITEGPRDVLEDGPKKPKKPRWFLPFVQQLLPGEQWMHFVHWLRVGLESLRAGDFRPGQAVVLAGPPGCGKSLLQHVVTLLFGGRVANPFSYMMGEKFNYDLAGAEHWMIEDPPSSTDIRARRLFGNKLKEATVNRDIAINQKGKDALLLPVFRRVTLSVNHETENLSVVPPFDASISDKIFLFLCDVADVGSDRKKTWETLVAEIPHLRAWLLGGGPGPLPAELSDSRFGIRAWHHPDLLKDLSDLSPEIRLLELIDHVIFETRKPDEPALPWEGKTILLERDLRRSEFQTEVQNLLKFTTACGVYLARLLKQQPERFSKTTRRDGVFWTIQPPAKKDPKE